MKDGRLLSEPLKFQAWRESGPDCPLEFAVVIQRSVVFNKMVNSLGSAKYIFYYSAVWLPILWLMLYDNILLIRALVSADLAWSGGFASASWENSFGWKTRLALFELPE